jgi:hypothetical protein
MMALADNVQYSGSVQSASLMSGSANVSVDTNGTLSVTTEFDCYGNIWFGGLGYTNAGWIPVNDGFGYMQWTNQSSLFSNYTGVVTLTNSANRFGGNGALLTALNATNVTGNLNGTTIANALSSGSYSSAWSGLVNTGAFTNNGNVNVNGTVTATTFTGNGSGLTNLNANNIASGTITDARLSANVPLLNGNNIFTASNQFQNVSNTGTFGVAGAVSMPGVVTMVNSANTLGGYGNLITSLNAANLVGNGSLPLAVLPVPVLTNNNAASVGTLTGTFTGNGAGLTNLTLTNLPAGDTNSVALGNTPNNGIYFPSNNAISFSLNGTNVLRLATNVLAIQNNNTNIALWTNGGWTFYGPQTNTFTNYANNVYSPSGSLVLSCPAGNLSLMQAGTTAIAIGGGNAVNVNAGWLLTAKGNIFLTTNTTCPTPVATGGYFWASNQSVLYWVTTTHTNYIAGP